MPVKTRDLILISMFAALMAVGAFVRIPFPVIPITLQPFFCALAGIILGSRLGVISQGIYVALGLAGAPVFTQGGGIMYILRPSFGYLLGFIAGAYIIGKVSERLGAMNLRNAFFSVISGLVVIYAIGVPYMYLIQTLYIKNSEVTFWYTISTNFPYFIKDLFLYIIVAITATTIIPILKRAGLIGSKA